MAGAGRCSISVLGPLSARHATGADCTPSGALQRRLLALLVLHRGQVVPVDAAIDALWPAVPPRDAVAALQNHVFRLRRDLPEATIESVGAGYRLDPACIDVDVDRVHALLSQPLDRPARAELTAVLGRWVGPAYPELEDTDAGRADAARSEELRMRAREALADAQLSAGETDGLVATLVAMVDGAPLRERPRSLLMAALDATGRTAEATRVYDEFRRLLGEELGIEPSAALGAQHAALLEGAPSAPPSVPRPLPYPATDLVGRGPLLGDLLASADATRVLTLVGPGGVGKTRLLLELGHRLRAAAPERPVVLCELAGADHSTTAEAMTIALGIDHRPGVPPVDRMVEVLGNASVVLLLDNCEHVLDPVAELVQRMTQACPRLDVVATSRERLRVPGETVRSVPSLVTDDDVAPAVDLFLQRARAVRADLQVTERERRTIGDVVRRLDGLPLAIELAAARLHTHDLAEVVAGLDRPLSLLTGGHRTSERHGSLSAVVDWSFGLLDAELQQTFAALSVFTRPFALPDASAVCALDPDETATRLARLVERSLVVRRPGQRYALLETLRAFGTERLAAAGQAEAVGERHARWFVDWAVAAGRRLHTDGDRVVDDIDAAVPELQTAVDWLLDHDLVEETGRLVTSLINYALLRLRPDVLSWAERVIAADPKDHSVVAARVWAAAGYLAWMTGDLDRSRACSLRAVALDGTEPREPAAEAAAIRGNQDLFAGHLDSAVEWYQRGIAASGDDPVSRLVITGAELLALGYAASPRAAEVADALLREVGDAKTPVAAYVWYCAGEADLATGSALARARLSRAIELAEATGASFVRGVAGASKASIEVRTGDPDVAADDYRWLIPHWQRAGFWATQWTMLRTIVELLERIGRPREAAVLEGAVRATVEGHGLFGADERTLEVVGGRLRTTLGDAAYETARQEGSELDGDAAAELALRCL